MAVGLIVTWAAHEEEALRIVPQSEVAEKSAAFAPVITTLGVARFHPTDENGFVNVTVCAAVVTPGATVPKSTAVGEGVTS